MNPFAALPGFTQLGADPLGAPVLLAMGIVACWCVVALIERGSHKRENHTTKGHHRSSGWW
jgi:hypothetical protein